MGIFDGLESLGFKDLTDADVFETAAKKRKTAEGKASSGDDPMDYIFLKEFTCPVCDKDFSNYIVRKSKLRLIGLDTDLRANYHTIDPNRYDVILCRYCGYASLYSSFNRISDRQIDLIANKITPNYIHKEYPVPISAEDAIERYKLALLSAMVKGVKVGERAILCLKTAWLYRDLKDTENERLFLQNALKGLKTAYSTETFPIVNLDDNTTQYMIAELARRNGDESEAMRWISGLVVSRTIPKNLKERAMNLKEMIRSGRR